MAASESYPPLPPERFQPEPVPDLIRGGDRIASRKRVTSKIQSPVAIPSERGPGYWLALPVLLFLAGAAAALGVSVLRTVPQGSEEALASGIFLKESL